MSILWFSIIGLICIFINCVHGNEGGWIEAHATFYGGGDASGTMGMLATSLYIAESEFLIHV